MFTRIRTGFEMKAIGTVLLAVLLLSACGDDDDSYGNDYTEVEGAVPNEVPVNGPITVWKFDYNDVGFLCNGDTGIYILSGDYEEMRLLPEDPECTASS